MGSSMGIVSVIVSLLDEAGDRPAVLAWAMPTRVASATLRVKQEKAPDERQLCQGA